MTRKYPTTSLGRHCWKQRLRRCVFAGLVAATPFQRSSGTSGTFPSRHANQQKMIKSEWTVDKRGVRVLGCSWSTIMNFFYPGALCLLSSYSIGICAQTSSQPTKHANKKMQDDWAWRFFWLKLGLIQSGSTKNNEGEPLPSHACGTIFGHLLGRNESTVLWTRHSWISWRIPIPLRVQKGLVILSLAEFTAKCP